MLYIVLPAFNEENNINSLLKKMVQIMKRSIINHDYTIVVVNDGSKDKTRKIVESFYSSESLKKNNSYKLFIISHKFNKGLAESLKTGLLFCLDRGSKGDIVITMDSDNTHSPELIISLLKKISDGNDIVIASRYKKGSKTIGIPFHRRLLSSAGSIIFRALFPIQQIKDYTSGYRAYRLEVLNKAFENIPNFISESGFSCMVDILLKLQRKYKRIIITEVPMILRYDLKKGRSKMNISKTIIDTFKLILKRKLIN